MIYFDNAATGGRKPDSVLRAGEKYDFVTIYAFDVE